VSAEAAVFAGFRRFGPTVLEWLRGTFALAIWDSERQRGLVGQDPMALSAIFVNESASGVAFATEVSELLRLLPARPEPDRLAVTHMLAGTASPPGRTLFSGVRRLMGGSCLVLADGRVETVQYWTPRYEGVLRGPQEELHGLLREELGSAVERAVGGDSRTGVLLSGGLDSSMAASTAAQRGIEVRGYTAVFPDHPELDESDYVDSVVSKWGFEVSSRAVPPRGSFAAALQYLDVWELPVLGIGYVLERGLAADMRHDGLSTVIDGQGGDELFAPSAFLPPHLVRRGRLARSLAMLRQTPSTAEIDSRRVLFEMWKRSALKPAFPLPLIEARRRRRGPGPTPPWLVPSARQLYGESLDEWSWRRSARGPLWWRWLADLLLTGPSASGRSDYVRHRSALAGLSGGSPLLDFDLARLVLRTPPELAFDQGVDRPFAREAMRGVLPEKVRTRTAKSSLFSFYRDILAGPDLAWVRRVLSDPGCAVYEFVERARLEPLLADVPPANETSTGLLLGALHSSAMLECWLRQQEDPSFVSGLLEEQDEVDLLTPPIGASPARV
jgi:asparagine synthase (glutamine-hydrolysing)